MYVLTSLPPSPNKPQVTLHITHITHSIITTLHAAKFIYALFEFKHTEAFTSHGDYLLSDTTL